jgi:alkylation response protein AidB-like acyl-CoA dehydrogenase
MAAWAAVLPLLKRVLPLPRLVQLVAPRRRNTTRNAAREEEVVALTRALYRRDRQTRDKCLERSLVTYRFLARLGAEPSLYVGMTRGHDGISGHVWTSLDEEPVHDSPELLAHLVPVLAFGPRAEARGMTEPSAGVSAGAPPST